jgi:hypothetical protein
VPSFIRFKQITGDKMSHNTRWTYSDDVEVWEDREVISVVDGGARSMAHCLGRTEGAILARLEHLEDPSHAAYHRLHSRYNGDLTPTARLVEENKIKRAKEQLEAETKKREEQQQKEWAEFVLRNELIRKSVQQKTLELENIEFEKNLQQLKLKEEEKKQESQKSTQQLLENALLRQELLQEELLRKFDVRVDERLETRLDALDKLMDDLNCLLCISPAEGPKGERVEKRLDDLVDRLTYLKDWLSTPVENGDDVKLRTP